MFVTNSFADPLFESEQLEILYSNLKAALT